MERSVFTDENILKFIGEYEKHPVQWDPKNKLYKVREKKLDA